MTKKKPPLGLMPKYMHEALRIEAITRALSRYNHDFIKLKDLSVKDRDTMISWCDELTDLISQADTKMEEINFGDLLKKD